MGVNCKILISTPREGVHKAGRPVTGIVRYAVDEPMKLKDIVLSLVGKGICTWRESRTRNRHKESIAYTGTDIYTSQCISIYDKKNQPTFILPIGSYEYPFTFLLPKEIPPSFQDSVCSIKYKIVLKFEKPHVLSFNKRFHKEINVYSYVTPVIPVTRTTFGLEKILFKPFSKRTHKVTLKAEISSTMFSPGENAEITYVVSNDTNLSIPSVKAELICYTTYTANCGKKLEKSKIIKECTVETPTIPENAVANMANRLPILSHLYSIQNSRIMVKQYKVKVIVRLPMPYINATTKIPVVIGEKNGDDDVARSVEEIGDKPPSYWEVMNEDKEHEASHS